jgi:hypothetical protein
MVAVEPREVVTDPVIVGVGLVSDEIVVVVVVVVFCISAIIEIGSLLDAL